jgi:hypothetical protein
MSMIDRVNLRGEGNWLFTLTGQSGLECLHGARDSVVLVVILETRGEATAMDNRSGDVTAPTQLRAWEGRMPTDQKGRRCPQRRFARVAAGPAHESHR